MADLLNEDFDCDDSELKNLDWEEWDEPFDVQDVIQDELQDLINKFDEDGNGNISVEELLNLMAFFIEIGEGKNHKVRGRERRVKLQ